MTPPPPGSDSRHRSSAARHGLDLPVQLTALIGREREVQAVCTLLQRADVRLVTLTGPGGIGKTRLGLQAAADLAGNFPDGVFFVSLSPLSDPALVAATVAQTMGVPEAGGTPIGARLKSVLRRKRALLVLDNFERLIAGVPVVTELLEACPEVKVLVTSRAVLHLHGEHDYPVPPLVLPARATAAAAQDAQTVAGSEAVRLFVERARAVQPAFRLTDENAAVVADICRRLDGLPLAIELAAARSRLLPPQALLARLENRLQLLVGGPQDLPERQQTLRGTIVWSFDLLTEAEKMLFRRLSVFVGGCTLAAVEATCFAAVDPSATLLESVAGLVDKSLLEQEAQEAAEPRFRMLETVREFGLEQLAASREMDTIRRRHAEHFLALAEVAEPGLVGPEQGHWLERLAWEHDNFRAALTYLIASDGPDARALHLALPLFLFWDVRGYHREALAWFQAALDRAGNAVTPARAWALSRMGGLAMRQGDSRAARAYVEQSLGLFRQLGDIPAIARLLSNLGTLAFLEGDLDAARALFDECVALCRDLGDRVLLANTLNNRGLLERAAGNLGAASAFLEECAVISREAGYTRGLAYALLGQGWVAVAEGDDRKAIASIDACVRLGQTLGEQRLQAYCVTVLAGAAFRERHRVRAVRLFAASASLLAAMGASRVEPIPAEADRLTAELRTALGEQAFAAAWAEGQALTLEQAIAAALEEAQEEPDAGAVLVAEPAPAGPADGSTGSVPMEIGGRDDGLTEREVEVLRLLAGGLTNREIAQQLVLSPRTVENHVFRIYARIGARGRADATAYAIHNGLI